tara:strand:- start:4277 stop:4621 length:345 start_codon:yes stop_codon:yes gene_type:complete
MTYPKNNHQHYHAHVYFERENSDFAYGIREHASQVMGLVVGNFNKKLVGPHLHWSFSIDFSHMEFDAVIEWLEEARQDLSVLIHAVTDNEYKDHTEYASWLGQPLPLKLSIFES